MDAYLGSKTTDTDCSNGHELLEGRKWSDPPIGRTLPVHCQG